MPTRVALGRLDAITGGDNQFGLYVAGPDGTVILDGTSDVFRILGSGTISLTGCDGDPVMCVTSATATVSTGLQYKPAHLSFLEVGNAAYQMPNFNFFTDGTLEDRHQSWTEWGPGFNDSTVRVEWQTRSDQSATTRIFRFFLLEQVAF